MFEFITLDNDSEYYVLKESMEASMLESVDLACYRSSDVYRNEDGSPVTYTDDNGQVVYKYSGCNSSYCCFHS